MTNSADLLPIGDAIGFQEVGALAPTFKVAKPRASAPEASGLKSPSKTFLPVWAEAPIS